MTLQSIVDNKRYPILFIGAGMSKRYLKNYPNWNELLQEYYERLELDRSYYSYLNDLRKKYKSDYPDVTDLNFKINTVAATFIESKFNDLFFDGKIRVENLTEEEAFSKGISAFKASIAQKFSKYELREDVNIQEVNALRRFLKKARMIITTNYDGFIENLLSDDEKVKPVVYIGQKGFFEDTIGWSEVYKIHGSYNDPNSIIINEEDYQKYDNNSVLISAKVLSTMIHSPIIFLGYSLNDRNVRKLLSDFTSQLPSEDERKKMSRITLIERKENQQFLNEFMQRSSGDEFGYSIIKTDNYKLIYDEISKINEGLSPKEILRYQSLVKEIVISAEKKGNLEAVLVTPSDLEEVENEVKEGKPIVVAMGNRRNIIVWPDYLNFIKDYFWGDNSYQPSIALKFAANDGNIRSRTPFVRLWKNKDIVSKLDENTKQKLEKKISAEPDLKTLKKTLPSAAKHDFFTIQEIKERKYPLSTELNTIIYNIDNIDRGEVDEFILKVALPNFEKIFSLQNQANNKTYYRKLFKAYDFLINGGF